MLRLALVAVVALALAPSADAWSWPCDGPVLRPFSLVDDPYAAGQHRGIDVGCGEGTAVAAPAAGTISFAGTLPGMGRGVTIQTADGYAVTLVQLRETAVSRGDVVDEGATVGVVGDSEDPVTRALHAHLGVRVASDPQGYVDPLRFLPQRSPPPPPTPAAPPVAVAVPAAKPAAPVVPPTAQPPAVAAPAQPAVAPVVAGSSQPAPAGSASAPAESTPAVAPATPAATADDPASAEGAEDSAGGLEIVARAAKPSVATSTVPAGDRSPRRSVGAPHRQVEARVEIPASGAARAASSGPGRSARAASPPAQRAVRRMARPVEPVAGAAPTVRVVAGEPREPLVRVPAPDGSPPLMRWWLVASLVAAAAAVALGAVRIMTARVRVVLPAEDPGRAGVAVRERAAPHRPRGGVRGPRGHLRAVSPPAGRRRPHGVRHRRARDARDGHRRSGRALAA
jgi:hypothetical protein